MQTKHYFYPASDDNMFFLIFHFELSGIFVNFAYLVGGIFNKIDRNIRYNLIKT